MKRYWLKSVFLLGIIFLIIFSFAFAQIPQDTVWVERLEKVLPNSQVALGVYITNHEALGAFSIPLAFPDTVTQLDIYCDSVSWVGSRIFDDPTSTFFDNGNPYINNAKNRLLVYRIWFTGRLLIGSGLVGKIYFRTGPTWDSTLAVPVDTTLWSPPITRLELVDTIGNTVPSPVFLKGALEVKEIQTPVKPTVFSLSQNYPNPFNPKTLIRFSLPKDAWVKMEVYNILGQKVKTLVDEKLTAGIKEVEWNGKGDRGNEVASGIYFYKIKADDFSDVKKMVMLK